MPRCSPQTFMPGATDDGAHSQRVPLGRALLLSALVAVKLCACAGEGPESAENGLSAADASANVGATAQAGIAAGVMRGAAANGAAGSAANGGGANGGAGMRAPRSDAAMMNITGDMAAAAGAVGNAAEAAAGAGALAHPGTAAAAGTGGANNAAVAGASAAGTGAAGSGVMSAAAGGGAAGSAGAAARSSITIWLAGDSTVAKGNTPCPVGWGAEFQPLFKPEAKVVNSAVGGRSVRTWLYEVQTQMDSSGECALNKDSSGEPVLQARWQQMLDAMSGMHAGDYLFIQFGINDSSATCDRHVGLDAFKESYGMMAEAAKMRGAQPIFVTPVSAISCQGSMARPTRGSFVTATTEAGAQYDVPVIDLHARSIELYNQQGLCPIPGGSDVSASTGGKTGAFFCDDHTHFADEGAQQIAKLVAQALRDQSIGLAAYLK